MIIPIILAGGSGTRLWPLSRQLYPKQLIRLVDDNTLLQNTLGRLHGLDNVADPMVICHQDHRFMVAEQIREINTGTAAIILEPAARNTAPAIAVAALQAAQTDPDAVLLVLPADHVIDNLPAFHAALDRGYDLAGQNCLITFGIVPTAPETGYGYICKGRAVDEENQAFALEKSTRDLDFLRLDPEAFAACPSDSIDYAVMEKTGIGAVIPIAAGWNDLGSWEALWQTGKKDDHSNVIHGDVLTSDVANSYLHAESRLVAAVGIENHVVVETKDAVLVAARDRVQDVKKLVNQLKTHARSIS
jgi:mannose-1-phosphate guanylyltransferase/mannose-1-phosphate guanylyltransferase/mannose-6-phosphate isomerase